MPRVTSSGWTVQITHPTTNRTLRPDVLDEPAFLPSLNAFAEIRIPVRKAPSWLDQQFDANPAMSVYVDGQQLPIDELVDVDDRQDRTILVGEGGVELRQRVTAEYRSESRYVAAEDLIDTETTYDSDVDTPTFDTLTDQTQQDPTTTADFDSLALTDANDPVTTAGDEFKNLPSMILTEAETASGATALTRSDFSDGGGRRLQGDESFSTDHTLSYTIPQANATLAWRGEIDGTNGHPPFDILVDGSTEFSAPADSLSGGIQWRSTVTVDQDLSGTVTVEFDSDTGDGHLDVDIIGVYDDRFSYTFDNSVHEADGYLDGPGTHPDGHATEFDDATTAFVYDAATATGSFDDTTGNQAISISTDQGSTYSTASNTNTVSVSNIDTTTLRVRITLDRHSPNGAQSATPRFNYASQTVTDFELTADIIIELLLIDETFDNDLASVLTEIAGSQYQWSYRLENGTPTVAWTLSGDRQASEDPQLEDAKVQKRLKTFEKVTVKGSNKPISDMFTASATFVGLSNDNILPGSETVSDGSGTTFDRGSDYEMDYLNGEIRTVSGGALTNGTSYNIDYRTEIRGTYTVSGASNPDELVETIPGVVSDSQAEQLAYVIAEVDPDLQNPRYEATLVTPRLDPTFDPLEALPMTDFNIPSTATPLAVKEQPELTPRGIQIRVGSARPLEAQLQQLQNQVRRVSRRS